MRVYDIYPEASEYLGTNDQTHIFRVGGRAAEYLANKGDWDVLKGYVDLQIQNNNIVVLPWQVETPLKFTIDDIPAFSRDRLYEFTLNGFGSGPNGADRMDYSWEDRGFSPTHIIPPQNGFRVAIPPSAQDAGKKVYIQGQTPPSAGNVEVKETLTINATDWFISVFHYGTLTEINKDKTIADVRLFYVTPPPPNDNWAQAEVVAGLASDPNAPVSGYTINATVQTGEPVSHHRTEDPDAPDPPDLGIGLPDTEPVFNTVWYKWTGVDQTKLEHFWTRKDYIIEVFTGTTLANLEFLAVSQIVNNVALVTWHQAFGIDYYIRVRPPSAEAAGSFGLRWSSSDAPPPPPPNDNFANGQQLTGANADPNVATITGSTINASVEPTEPNAAQVINTVWYYWVGINSGDHEQFWTRQDHVIDVYRGSTLTSLVFIATSHVTNNVAMVEFVQTVGITYWIRVRPLNQNAVGLFGLTWRTLGGIDPPEGPPPSTNDLAPAVYLPDFDVPVDAPPVPLEPHPLPPSPTPPDGTQLIAQYFPNETNPRYRVIRLSQTGATARFLFRRKVFKIVSMDDFIPIQSELGFLTMLQAIQALRRKDMEVAKAMADAAVEITTDAQRATTGFIELANNTEVQSARDYNLYNRDSVIMLDIFDDVAKILGNVGRFNIYDHTTNALEVLCTKGHWDGYTGYVDIVVDGWRNVTLPRFVDQPITISINGQPSYMRNKWSEFHLNGPGSDESGGGSLGEFDTWSGSSGNGRWGQIRAWDAVGEVCTIKPLRAVSQLTAIPDDISDDGRWIRIFGYDETGKWITSNGEDGFLVMTNHSKIVPAVHTDQRVARIVRITRQATNGFVRLYAFDIVDQTQSDLMGYYYPDETEPKYFRLKLPCDAQWIRLRYRKRTLKITSVWQPLHLHSRMAITTMVRSLKALETDATQSQVLEDKAVKFLDDDQKARNPGETFQLQFNEDCGWNSNFITS